MKTETTTKKTLKTAGLQPIKGLGQNFLIDKSVLKRVVEAADLKPEETVIEIGPGLGALTQELAKRVKKVIAVEKDQKMVETLKNTLKEFKNVEIVQGDILKIPHTKYKIPDTKYKVVANLPYYITSPVIRKFLESGNPPEEMVLMVQKEVAQRICATPPDMSLLATSVQFYAAPKIISFVSKKSFWPKPKVDSAIIRMIPINKFAWAHSHSARPKSRASAFRILFFKIVKAGFSQPRKQILNNLSNGLKLNKDTVKSWLLKNNIQPEQRAETLSIEDWAKLAKTCGYNL